MLERALSVQLFERTSVGLRLTARTAVEKLIASARENLETE
jgi:DNA-binding transcriptional LysR family regulator